MRHPHHAQRSGAFTLLELLIVMAIIIVLAGLVIGTSGYVQKKGARSRAEAEIAALSSALESYKADNGTYPRDPNITDRLNARNAVDPANYNEASRFLYAELSGDRNSDRVVNSADRLPGETADPRPYFTFKPNMLSPKDQTQPVVAIRDPFGNSYGYSTAYQNDPSMGYNPTFDLWSTGGGDKQSDVPGWIKNW
jgi:type II secretory pathway pseudopilin PulG